MTETVPLPTTEDLDVRPRRGWKPYPGYKESEVEWFTEIPAHWAVKRLKYASYINPESLPETTPADREFRYLDISNVDSNGHLVSSEPMVFRDAPTRARRIVRRGDTILSTVRTYLKAIAYIDTECDDLIVSTGFAVLRPRSSLDAAFQSYVVRSEPFVQAVMSHSEGVGYPAIAPSELGCLPIWLPSLPEQRAIAAFLDRETAKIDALVVRKQRLIDLLHEKRSALITRAVTKGLDPTVPMKDSGVEWLERIPAHWVVLPLRRLAGIRYGLGQPPRELSDGVPLVRATNISRGRILSEGMMYADPDDVPVGRNARLAAQEIIVVRSGAYTGDSAIVPEAYAGAVAGYDMIVTIRRGHPQYFAWQFLTQAIYGLQFGFYRLRAAQPHLNAEELGRTLVVVPPMEEQQAIAQHLQQKTARLDAVIAEISKGIGTLKEYRTALISAAVTGKIDVRGEA
jgi:type I restriction enzyme S subunit